MTPERLNEIKRQAEALTYEPTRRAAFELLAEVELLQDLIMDMAGPTVAWAQACARQADLPPGEFRPDHRELIGRINAVGHTCCCGSARCEEGSAPDCAEYRHTNGSYV